MKDLIYNITFWVFCIFWAILFFLFLITVIEVVTQKYIGTRMTECYGKYGNEIMGVDCKEEVYCGVISRFFNACEIGGKS